MPNKIKSKEELIEQNQQRNGGICYADCQIESTDEEKMTVELSFSSEEPYRRWFGYEILSHEPGAVDLSRLENSAPLLVQHDPNDQPGVVERAWVEDLRGKAVTRFSRNSDRAKELFADVKDGIRPNISVGYQILDAEITGTKDGEDVWTVTRWQPFEISLVSVPADQSVGVGRSQADLPPHTNQTKPTKENTMPKETPAGATPEEVAAAEKRAATTAREDALKQERTRAKEIHAIAEQFGKRDLADDAIADGQTVDQFRKSVLDTFERAPGETIDPKAGFIGMTEKETRQYSLLNVLRALADPSNRQAQDAIGFERELSQEVQRRSGVTASGIIVPFDVLSRELTVGAHGGNLVGTETQANGYIEMLRNSSAVMQNATILTGLTGNLDIPIQTATAEGADYDENGEIALGGMAFDDKLTLSPKRVGASIAYGKQLLAQSSLDIENLVRNDILNGIMRKIDWNAVNADGTGDAPKGIRHTTGVNAVVMGDNGGKPSWGSIVALETEVAVDNADIGAMQYLLNAKTRGFLKTTPKEAGQPQYIIGENGQINGYNYGVSNQLPGDLTKGTGTNLSTVLFGNFAQLVLAFWGGVDLTVDTLTQARSGKVVITGDQFYDVGVRQPGAFAMIDDAEV